jgi:hypothetical protein
MRITCNTRNFIRDNSCEPCAVQSFLGNRLQLRALSDIRIGDEVTISYTDCLDTAAQRKRKLQVTLPAPSRPLTRPTHHHAVPRSTTDLPALVLAASHVTPTLHPGACLAARAAQQLPALSNFATPITHPPPSSTPTLTSSRRALLLTLHASAVAHRAAA